MPADLLRLLAPLSGAGAAAFSPVLPPAGGRESAVLVLFGRVADRSGFDLLFTERAHTLNSHAGQVSFPGGRVDPGDAGPVEAALREAQEETGADPAGIRVIGSLPVVGILPSRSRVVPVLAWWAEPGEVAPVDPAEVARVLRVPLLRLADPDVRVRVAHTSGRSGPGFVVEGLLIWGFTGGLVSAILRLTGLERPWDDAPEVDLADWQSLRRPPPEPG